MLSALIFYKEHFMDTIISLRGVEFRGIISYPQIDIARGAPTFICGESGCGKSTLLRLINATLSPDKGEIIFNGRDISKMNAVELRRQAILVSQNVFLFDGTVGENFDTFRRYRDMPPLDGGEIAELLKICCAPFSADADCTTMSGGERQRVYAAVCLSFRPEVIMMDEPTSALDETTSGQFMERVCRFCAAGGITPVVVSHDRKLADRFAENVINLERKSANERDS